MTQLAVAEPILTCKECFCWLPVKKGYKCVVSGKKRLGTMFACQFVESRRALLVAIQVADETS